MDLVFTYILQIDTYPKNPYKCTTEFAFPSLTKHAPPLPPQITGLQIEKGRIRKSLDCLRNNIGSCMLCALCSVHGTVFTAHCKLFMVKLEWPNSTAYLKLIILKIYTFTRCVVIYILLVKK